MSTKASFKKNVLLGFVNLLILLVISLNPIQGNAKVIVSKQDGAWTSANTWLGGAVPSSSDFVIVQNNILLDANITIGNNKLGALSISSKGSLQSTSNQTITLSGGYNYTLSNQGSLNLYQLILKSGGNATNSSFIINYGRANIKSVVINSGNLIRNNGTFSINNDLNLNGGILYNDALGKLYCVGNLKLTSPTYLSKIYNFGLLEVQSKNNTDALNIDNGSLYNQVGATLNVKNGQLYQESNTNSLLTNEGKISAYSIFNKAGSVLSNFDTIMVSTDFKNGGYLTNNLGGVIIVNKNFINYTVYSSKVTNNGYIKSLANLSNDGPILNDGYISIDSISYNSSTGTITGSGDVCDNTNSTSYVFDGNYGTIASSITKCSTKKLCASNPISKINGLRFRAANQIGLNYSINYVWGASYNWTSSGDQITSSTNNQSITLSTGSNFNQNTLSVQVNNTCGVLYQSIPIINLNTKPNKPSPINAFGNGFCSIIDAFTYSVDFQENTDYVWSIPSGWQIINGANTNSIMVKPSGNGGIISVYAKNQVGQSDTSSFIAEAVGIINTPINIAGFFPACAKSPYTYSINPIPGATSYNWTVPTGWSLSKNGDYQVKGSTNSAGGTISITPINGCGNGTTISKVVAVTSGVPNIPFLTGLVAPCSSNPSKYYAVSYNANLFNWTLPSGWKIASSNAMKDTVMLIPNGGSGTISVNATNACGTGGTISASLKSVLMPLDAGAIAGNTSICDSSIQNYSISAVNNAIGYSWIVPITWKILSGQGSNSIKVLALGSGKISVTPSNGSCTSKSAYLNITAVKSNFAKAGTSTSICAGSSITLGSASQKGHIYSWTSNPSGFTSLSSSIIVNPKSTTTYYLTESIAGTSCKATDSTKISLNPLPSKLAGPDITVCQNQSTSIGLSAVSGLIYSWTSQSSGFSSSLANPKVSPSKSEVYFLKLISSKTGCTQLDTVNVNVNLRPIADAGKDQIIKTDSTQLSALKLNSNESCIWSLISGAGRISSSNSSKTAIYGLKKCINTFAYQLKNNSTGCIANDTVMVTFDHNSTAIISTLNIIDTFKNGFEPIHLLDADTSIVSASIKKGYSLPLGFGLNSINGTVNVTNQSLVMSGKYLFLISTKDACLGFNDVTINLNINTDKEATSNGLLSGKINIDRFINKAQLVSFSDSNGTIQSAEVFSGSMPKGLSLNPSNGEISVQDSTLITLGSKNFNIKTVENLGGQTIHIFNFSVISDKEAVYTQYPVATRKSKLLNDTLAAVSDSDGIISSAKVIGGSLPSGTTLNSSSGRITITDTSKFTNGSYSVTIQTKDITGGLTNSTLSFKLVKPTLAFIYLGHKSNSSDLDWYANFDAQNGVVLQFSKDGKVYQDMNVLAFGDLGYYKIKSLSTANEAVYSNSYYYKNNIKLKAYFDRDNIKYSIKTDTKSFATLEVIDIYGQIMYNSSINLVEGDNSNQLNGEWLTKGYYFLRINVNGQSFEQTVIKQQ